MNTVKVVMTITFSIFTGFRSWCIRIASCCGSASVSGYVSENAICQIRNMRIRHNIILGSGLEIMVLLCYLETGTLDTGQSNFDFIL